MAHEILLALGSSERPKWSLQEEEKKESWLLRASPRHKWFKKKRGQDFLTKNGKCSLTMGYFTVQVKLYEKSFSYPYVEVSGTCQVDI